MLRRLLSLSACLLLGVSLTTPLCAQPTSRDQGVPPADLRPKDNTSGTSESSHIPVGEFLVAGLGTALVLFILCMPSRKG